LDNRGYIYKWGFLGIIPKGRGLPCLAFSSKFFLLMESTPFPKGESNFYWTSINHGSLWDKNSTLHHYKSYQKTSHKRNSYADNLQVNSNPTRSCYCECFTNTLIPISSHFMLLGTTRFFLVAFSPIFIPSHYCWKLDENLILPEFFQPFLSPKIR
jgi:hypothetical protein